MTGVSTSFSFAMANQLRRPAFGSRRDPDRVFDRIVAETGEAKGDRQFVDDFRSLLRWWAEAENLMPVGWQAAQTFVRRHLANRARVRGLIAEHPAIEQEPIDKPVFVVGLPRSATTLTHRVLSISAAVESRPPTRSSRASETFIC